MTTSRATPTFVFVAVLLSSFAASQAGAQGKLPTTHSAKPADKPRVTPKKPATLDGLNLKVTIEASEGSTAQAMRGITSSSNENPGGEKDDPYVAPARSPAMSAMRAVRADLTSYNFRHISKDPKSQSYLNAIKSGLSGFEFKTALLAEHKYMIADCIGIKVSAGEFAMRVPDPDVRIDNTGIIVTFAVPHVEMSAVKFRFRPDLTDTQQPCHFSGKVGIGASADDLRLEFHFDPILNLEQCKLADVGTVTTVWRIGHLRMSPLPPDVVDLGANIVEDALTFGSNYSILERIVATLNGAAISQCHK